MAELERRLNAGRDRVAAEKRAADAKAAALRIVNGPYMVQMHPRRRDLRGYPGRMLVPFSVLSSVI
jgi:hypothetical protein